MDPIKKYIGVVDEILLEEKRLDAVKYLLKYMDRTGETNYYILKSVLKQKIPNITNHELNRTFQSPKISPQVEKGAKNYASNIAMSLPSTEKMAGVGTLGAGAAYGTKKIYDYGKEKYDSFVNKQPNNKKLSITDKEEIVAYFDSIDPQYKNDPLVLKAKEVFNMVNKE